MTEISAIGVQQTPVIKKGKMTKVPEIGEELLRIVGDFLKNNPNTTDDQLKAEIRNSLQGRVSPKKLAQINSETIISEARQYAQNVTVPTAPPASTAIPVEHVPSSSIRAKYMPIEQKATNYYYNELPTTKQDWQKRHQKELQNVKSAFGNDQQYLEYLQRVSPQTYQEEMALRAQQAPKETNNAGKKQANAEYVSSKKRKQQKRMNEAASQAEHKKQQVIKDKSQRNAIYVTEQGQMTTEARRAYKKADRISEMASDNAFRNEIRRQEQSVLGVSKSAEESARVFAENGFGPAASPTGGHARRHGRRAGSSGGYSFSTSPSPSHSSTSSTASSVVSDTVKPGVKEKIEETVKPKPGNGSNGGKGKYWLIAAIATGLGMLGYGLYAKHKNKQAENRA